MYLVDTAALVECMVPSADQQEEPCQDGGPSCNCACEVEEQVAVGTHSELPLVSDSFELGHFHQIDHWKGGEASECSADLQHHILS
jgi:hypothetical protein